MKTKLILLLTAGTLLGPMRAPGGTIAGMLEAPDGLPIKNGVLTFQLEQAGLMVGTGSVVPLTATCYTSTDGTVAGLPNPLSFPVTSVQTGTGSLPAGIYYVETTFYLGATESLPSPELRIQITSAGTLSVQPPSSFPPNATGMRVYIGTTPGAESLQGQTTGSTTQWQQSTTLVSGAMLPLANTSSCSIAFNDTIIPYSGYNVSLSSASGEAYPGWPQAWQLNGGLNGIVNISSGAPLWNGAIVYPQPILAQPLNHGPQSISGNLNMSGYNLIGAGAIGVGTGTPSWPLDVENGPINSSGGYLYDGGAGTSGQCLVSNGSAFVPGGCLSSTALYYQLLQSNGAAQPQEPALNFSSSFQTADTPGTTTSIALAPTGVVAGSYTNATIAVNAAGQVVSAGNGKPTPQIQEVVVTSGICTTGNAAFANCSMTINWPAVFADTNYAVSCTPQGPTALALASTWITNKAVGSFQYFIQNEDTSGANPVSLTEIDCIGVHP